MRDQTTNREQSGEYRHTNLASDESVGNHAQDLICRLNLVAELVLDDGLRELLVKLHKTSFYVCDALNHFRLSVQATVEAKVFQLMVS